MSEYGGVWQARSVLVRRGVAEFGEAGTLRRGTVRQGKAGMERHGAVR